MRSNGQMTLSAEDHAVEPFTQFCYVARDFEVAIDKWVLAGAGPFFELDLSGLTDRDYRGTVARDTVRLGFGFLGTSQVEIVQPTNDAPSIYREVLDTRGEVLHHIQPKMRPISAELFDAESARYESMGLKLAYSLTAPGVGRVAFFDGTEKLGFFIELVERSEEWCAKYAWMYEEHLNWNGKDPIRRL